ncbi:MAG: hypothetical protein EPN88_14260 [Bacteroidetes bacterium]|nr:MAG: hypothetical protein EPN88_14260 [Bacteroidota bacterium]
MIINDIQYSNEIMHQKFNGIIYLKSHNERLNLEVEKILFFRAEGSYTKVIMEDENRTPLISKSLCFFELLLNDKGFFRCHNSYLVNLKQIKSYNIKNKIITFKFHTIPLSRRRSNEFIRILSDYGVRYIRT